MENKKTEKELLSNMLRKYFGYRPETNEEKELELRFGLGENSITQTQFNSVINKLKTSGFILLNSEGDYKLRINPMTRGKSGYFNQSFVRIEINELNNIQNYCRTEYFDTVNIPDYIHIIQKKLAIDQREADKNNPGKTITKWIYPVNFKNSNFRVNYKIEKTLSTEDKITNNILREWPSSKKIYRYLKRYRFKTAQKRREAAIKLISEQDLTRYREIGKNVLNFDIEEFGQATIFRVEDIDTDYMEYPHTIINKIKLEDS